MRNGDVVLLVRSISVFSVLLLLSVYFIHLTGDFSKMTFTPITDGRRYDQTIDNVALDDSDKCNGRIDVVWTYVNGSEPKFVKKLKKYGKVVDPQRYRDYGSLFYSMRSVYKNVEFSKKWFLVVESESQIPTFLNQSTFKESNGYQLEIIYHHQIFPDPKQLPNFNSAAIESNFHRIPGLSECFIYLNDDFFVHNPVDKSFFVESDGRPIVYSTKKNVPRSEPHNFWARQLRYTSVILNRYFETPNKKRKYISHNAYFMKKSILEDLNTKFQNVMDLTRSQRFRTRNDVVIPFMHAQFALEQNLAVGRTEDRKYAVYMYFNEHESKIDRVSNTLKKKNLRFYCLNDDISPGASLRVVKKQSERLSSLLNDYYPEPTPFENRIGSEGN
ncbi:hypothetical protein QTN25_006728 [Entamoeba marina]